MDVPLIYLLVLIATVHLICILYLFAFFTPKAESKGKNEETINLLIVLLVFRLCTVHKLTNFLRLM